MFDDRYDVVSDGCLAFSIGNCFVEELFRYFALYKSIEPSSTSLNS